MLLYVITLIICFMQMFQIFQSNLWICFLFLLWFTLVLISKPASKLTAINLLIDVSLTWWFVLRSPFQSMNYFSLYQNPWIKSDLNKSFCSRSFNGSDTQKINQWKHFAVAVFILVSQPKQNNKPVHHQSNYRN